MHFSVPRIWYIKNYVLIKFLLSHTKEYNMQLKFQVFISGRQCDLKWRLSMYLYI